MKELRVRIRMHRMRRTCMHRTRMHVVCIEGAVTTNMINRCNELCPTLNTYLIKPYNLNNRELYIGNEMTWWVNMCFLHLTRLACAHFVTLQKNTYIVKINMRPLLYKHCHSQTQMSCIVLMWYIDSFAKDGLENIKWIYYLIGKFPPFSIFHEWESFRWLRNNQILPSKIRIIVIVLYITNSHLHILLPS